MSVKNFGLSRISNGHYLLPSSYFEKGQVFELAPDFKVPDGHEVYGVVFVDNHAQGASRCSCRGVREPLQFVV